MKTNIHPIFLCVKPDDIKFDTESADIKQRSLFFDLKISDSDEITVSFKNTQGTIKNFLEQINFDIRKSGYDSHLMVKDDPSRFILSLEKLKEKFVGLLMDMSYQKAVIACPLALSHNEFFDSFIDGKLTLITTKPVILIPKHVSKELRTYRGAHNIVAKLRHINELQCDDYKDLYCFHDTISGLSKEWFRLCVEHNITPVHNDVFADKKERSRQSQVD
ncbi:MAG: hypothetical protein ACIAQZ_01710 [Sedimentisphaeraceae bacterium JB056]